MITIREEEIGRTFMRNTDEGLKKMCYFREQLFALKQICKHEKEASAICRVLLADQKFCLISQNKEGSSIWIEVHETMNAPAIEEPKMAELPMQLTSMRTAVAKGDTSQLSIRNFSQSLPTQSKEKVVACSDGLIIFRHARV
jgi:hypothetical protein